MLKNKLFLTLCLLCSVTFSGCDSEKEELDGKWPPIQITINGKKMQVVHIQSSCRRRRIQDLFQELRGTMASFSQREW